jgi:hypothetical protein
MEQKQLYYEVADNADMNITVHDLEMAFEVIEAEVAGISKEDLEEFQFTITPVFLTHEEYEALGEAD